MTVVIQPAHGTSAEATALDVLAGVTRSPTPIAMRQPTEPEHARERGLTWPVCERVGSLIGRRPVVAQSALVAAQAHLPRGGSQPATRPDSRQPSAAQGETPRKPECGGRLSGARVRRTTAARGVAPRLGGRLRAGRHRARMRGEHRAAKLVLRPWQCVPRLAQPAPVQTPHRGMAPKRAGRSAVGMRSCSRSAPGAETEAGASANHHGHRAPCEWSRHTPRPQVARGAWAVIAGRCNCVAGLPLITRRWRALSARGAEVAAPVRARPRTRCADQDPAPPLGRGPSHPSGQGGALRVERPPAEASGRPAVTAREHLSACVRSPRATTCRSAECRRRRMRIKLSACTVVGVSELKNLGLTRKHATVAAVRNIRAQSKSAGGKGSLRSCSACLERAVSNAPCATDRGCEVLGGSFACPAVADARRVGGAVGLPRSGFCFFATGPRSCKFTAARGVAAAPLR